MTDWPEMVRLHGPLVWRTVYRLVGREADAADCFQEAFVAALEVSRKGPVDNWPGLLTHLATARAIDLLRRRVAREAAQRPLEADVGGLGARPDATAAERELRDGLRTALAAIDPRQAEAFCLACLDDVPYRDVADRLGVTVSHVGVLIHRARDALKRHLKQHDPSRTTTRTEETRT